MRRTSPRRHRSSLGIPRPYRVVRTDTDSREVPISGGTTRSPVQTRCRQQMRRARCMRSPRNARATRRRRRRLGKRPRDNPNKALEGAVVGGGIGAMVGAGIPEGRVKEYESGLKNGGILMGVKTRTPEDRAYFDEEWGRDRRPTTTGRSV